MGVVLPPRTFAGCFGPIFLARFGWFGFGWFGLDWIEGVRWSFLGVWLSRPYTSLFSLPSTLLQDSLLQDSLSYFEIVSSDNSNWIWVI